MNKSISFHIESSLKKALGFHKLGQKKSVLGVSGGADSIALLYAMHALKQPVVVVHVDYGLRGDESAGDTVFVAEVCEVLSVKCLRIKAPVKTGASGNFQNWARNFRYAAFREAMKSEQAEYITLGHHRQDNIETIVQKIFRGSAPANWRGMEMWNGEIFRPLLEFSKQELIEYVQEKGGAFRQDSSNFESKYARNFIRNEISPGLDKWFPGWQENLLNLKEWSESYSSALQYFYSKAQKDAGLNKHLLSEYPEIWRQAVLKEYAEQTCGVSLSSHAVKELNKAHKLQVGKFLEVSPGFRLFSERNILKIYPERMDAAPFATIEKEQLLAGEVLFNGKIRISMKMKEPAGTALYADINRMHFPLHIREWRKGDRIIPFGMKGSQLVSDHLTNRKIEAGLKKKSLVLIGSDGTIYAIIYPGNRKGEKLGCIHQAVACTTETAEFLTIEEQ